MNIEKIRSAVSRFQDINVLVIGDIIVDHFIWGSVSRISPEAPVPVVNVTGENLLLGGSANVLHNLYSLGARAAICGVIGQDYMGEHLRQLLTELDSPLTGVIQTTDRPTTQKTRIIAQGQQVVRFDREKATPLGRETLERLNNFINFEIDNFDVVIISDYAKGVINSGLMDFLRTKLASSPKKIPMIVDPKPGHPEYFTEAAIITPNNHEAELMSSCKIHDDDSLSQAAARLQEMLRCEAVLITRGEKGMALQERGKDLYTIPTVAKEVYDVTGAGDTVIASLSLGLAGGLTYVEAAALANFAAGIVVGKVGTATASKEELLKVIS